jgi:hypothetical protein
MIVNNVKQLIEALTDLSHSGNGEQTLDLTGNVEVGVNDEWKNMDVKFSEISVSSNHPNKIKIHLS